MNAMNYDRKGLKERAKASLRGVRPRTWKVALVFLLLTVFLPTVISWILGLFGQGSMMLTLSEMYTDPETWARRIQSMDSAELVQYYLRLLAPAAGLGMVSMFLNVLMRLLEAVLNYGYMGYALKLFRGEQTRTGDIFAGFSIAGRVICTALMVYILTTVWTMAAVVPALCATVILGVAAAAFEASASLMILIILLMIAVWVGVVIFSLLIGYRYSLAPYLILTTDMGTMDAIRESRLAMRGNLGRRWMLDLSFLGWDLLQILISMVVYWIGYFALVFGVMFSVIFQSVDDPAMLEQLEAGQLMGPLFIGVVVVVALASLARVPLMLWLTPYRASARAGFFLTVTGQDDAPTPPQSATEYIPPQPSGIWDNVPPPPSFTTPEAPVTEQRPTVEAPVVEPQAGAEAPVEPVAEAPAEPEAPAVETPVEQEKPVVEAPAEPEAETPAEGESPAPETPEEPEAPAEEPKGEEQV